jgi:NAD(P)-dependent dehydrogenase (short-subunit alcohol dehydrogenase family)
MNSTSGRLQGKVSLITGAASGIAQATALRFAEEGAALALVDMNADGLEETAQAVRAKGIPVMTVPADVAQSADVQRMIQAVTGSYGRLDVVFNAVGVSGRRWGDGPVADCTEEAWDRVLSVNLTSMFLVCKYTVPHLLAARGAIVNLSSVLGIVGGDEDFATHAYAASKGAIISLSRAMASYYAPHGLRVNVVAPGLIATAMSRRAQSDPHIQERLSTLQPLTGAMGEPADIAAAVAYLASDDARFVTGTVLTVDGGWTMR